MENTYATILVDLLATPSVIGPIFVLLALVAVGFVMWRLHLPDQHEGQILRENLKRHLARRREEEARLMAFATTGELPPAQLRMNGLHRGTDTPHLRQPHAITSLPIGLLDLAHRYGFEAYLDDGAVYLFDIELPELEVARRVVTLSLQRVMAADDRQLYGMVRGGRKTINERAKQVGIQPVKRPAGRPAKRLKGGEAAWS
jgi:hypothetical protein